MPDPLPSSHRELPDAAAGPLRAACTAVVDGIDPDELPAPSRQRVLDASLHAFLALLPTSAKARVSLTLGSPERMRVVAAAGRRADELKGLSLDLSKMPEEIGARLLDGQPIEIDAAIGRISSVNRFRASLARWPRARNLIPLVRQEGSQGMLVLETSGSLPSDVRDSVETLAALHASALTGGGLEDDLSPWRSANRFRALVQNSADLLILVDLDTTITYVTPSVQPVLGYKPAQLVGSRLRDLLHPDSVSSALAFLSDATRHDGVTAPTEWRASHRNGSSLEVETTAINLLDDPNVGQIVLNLRDITARKALELQLSHQAFHDPLTDLANRALFWDRVEHALLSRKREHIPLAVLVLDLDNFKNVNDSLGHVVGDELLVAAAKRIRSCLRQEDTAARPGGDEFAILLEDASGDAAMRVAERIIEAFKAPFTLQGKTEFIQTSIGIAIHSDGESVDNLLRNADIAMYMAKSAGKGCFAVFEPKMHADAVERLELESDLRRAVQNEEFVLHYQPIAELKTGRVVGVEALIRWEHPERGFLPPSSFIPRAEHTGIILPMGKWVLREACKQVAEWNRTSPQHQPLFVGVNLSGKQFESPTLVEDIAAVLDETEIDPRSVMLELTESMMMHNSDATIELLKELKALGVRLAVDDFGTGYSSLHYLPSFPIDVLKIAKPFVDGIEGGTQESTLLYTIVDLCRTLGLQALAEGVESASQAEKLRKLRCDWAQGYYLSKPVNAEQMIEPLGSRKLADYAADVHDTAERREAEWWRQVVGEDWAASA